MAKKKKKDIRTRPSGQLFVVLVTGAGQGLLWQQTRWFYTIRGKFCPGKLTLGKFCPGKILSPRGLEGEKVNSALILAYIFSLWQHEIELSLKTAGKFLSWKNTVQKFGTKFFQKLFFLGRIPPVKKKLILGLSGGGVFGAEFTPLKFQAKI